MPPIPVHTTVAQTNKVKRTARSHGPVLGVPLDNASGTPSTGVVPAGQKEVVVTACDFMPLQVRIFLSSSLERTPSSEVVTDPHFATPTLSIYLS